MIFTCGTFFLLINGPGCLDMQEFKGPFTIMVFRREIGTLLLFHSFPFPV